MRAAMRTFAAEAVQALPMEQPIVEIGARPAAGQEDQADLRTLFPGQEYIACDVQEGPGVDRVEDVHALTFPDGSVGTVVSLDTLEHVADPIRAMQEVHRVLRPGGVAVITSVMFFPIHAHPWDFWRFTPEGFSLLLEPFESSLVLHQGWDLMPESVLGVGVKGPLELRPEMFPETHRTGQEWSTRHGSVDLGPIRMTVRELWAYTAQQTARAVRAKAQKRLRR
jgi:SAM-dependent methyltransferase